MSKLVLAAAAALVLAGPALAAPADNDTPAKTVAVRGLNLSNPVQAQRFYVKLQRAARQVCQAGSDRPAAGTEDLTCVRQNMQDAVRAANTAQLTALLNNTYGPGAANSTAYATDAR